jgi:hypothetical protein
MILVNLGTLHPKAKIILVNLGTLHPKVEDDSF